MPWNVKQPDLKNNPSYLEPRITAAESQLADIATNINLFPRQIPELDDSARFVRTMNALPNKGGTVLFPSGTFMINNVQYTPNKPITIKGVGINATTITRNTANPFFVFNSGGTGSSAGIFIDIEDMTFDGAAYHALGIGFLYIEQLRMKNVKVKNCGVAGYAAGNRGSIDGVYAYYVNRLFVEDCIFDGNEREGLHALPVQHMYVTRCFFVNNGRLGAVNEPDVSNPRTPTSMYPLTTVYTDNYCENNGSGGLHGESDNTISGWKPLDMQFIGNKVINCGNDNWTIGWGLIFGVYTRGIAIGNKIINQATTVSASGATNYRNGIDVGNNGAGVVILSDNEVLGCGQIGISINTGGSGVPVILKGNHIKGAGAAGMYLYNSQGCTIDGNTIENSQKEGIMLNDSSFTNVVGNKIKNNSQLGANLYSGITSITSSELIINSNEITGANHQYAFNLDSISYISSINFIGNRIQAVGTSAFSFANSVIVNAQITPDELKMYGAGIPSSGTFSMGAYVKNTSTFEAGTSGSKYYVIGWFKVTTASTNTLNIDWKADTRLSGN